MIEKPLPVMDKKLEAIEEPPVQEQEKGKNIESLKSQSI